MSEMPTIPQLLDRLALDRSSAERTIEELKANLENNPKYALERSGNAFNAAAVLENAFEIKSVLEYVQEEDVTPEQAEALIRRLNNFFSQRIAKCGVSGSNSGSHRMMDAAIANVSASWYDEYRQNGITQKVVNRVIREKARAKAAEVN